MKEDKSAGAVIFREEGERLYLLLQYEAGHWGFVKGRIEEGETLKETVSRETVEETGIRGLDFMDGFEESIHYFFRGRSGEEISKEVVFLLARTDERDVTLSREHQDFAWLPFGEAVERLTFDETERVLREAERFLESS